MPNKIVDPCETCGKKNHTKQECYSGANWANRPQWWKTPKATPPNNIPIPQQPQGQYVKESLQVAQPQYHNQATGQMGYLPPPQMPAQRPRRRTGNRNHSGQYRQYGKTHTEKQ